MIKFVIWLVYDYVCVKNISLEKEKLSNNN